MIAKFQIILEGVTPLKIQCLKTFSDERLEAERKYYLIKGFSKYSHYCLKSAYERFIQGRERY